MIDIVPAVLWIIGLILPVAVCVISVRRSRGDRGSQRPIEPVPWPVVGIHFGSLVLAMVPYVVYLMIAKRLSPSAHRLYESLGWWSAAVMIALIGAGLALMYRQARRSMRSQRVGISDAVKHDDDSDSE